MHNSYLSLARSGRKRICLLFCILYATTCGLLLFPFFPLLLLGRVFGGISTSILFSAFESWLVSSSSNAALTSEDLSTIMGRATLVNGFVATTAGVCRISAKCWPRL
jgi:MFS transporter, MFS domain-containing protein family, molybdate-anion transporter